MDSRKLGSVVAAALTIIKSRGRLRSCFSGGIALQVCRLFGASDLSPACLFTAKLRFFQDLYQSMQNSGGTARDHVSRVTFCLLDPEF